MNTKPSNNHPLTIMDAVQAQLHNAEAPAILAPGKRSLSYGTLYRQMQYVGEKIRSLGIEVHDRIALMVPDGPEMAVALLSIASASACVPLNSHLKEGECECYLEEVGVKAFIVQKGLDSPGLKAAQKKGVMIITLVPLHEKEAGLFRLEGGKERPCSEVNFPQVNDTALILSTSGTTSKPKLIPISHAIICASVKTIVSRAHLSTHDRCLNPMPLHHLYGIQTGVFSSIFSGGSVVCPRGFEPQSFFEWLEEFRPTWFTSVTPMLQSLLSIASSHDEMIRRNPLRFIRAGTVALPYPVQERVEHIFSAPVSVSYGLTEANPVTSGPLPPGKTKPGSVGTPANMNVAIVDEKGTRLPPGEIGEIITSGPFIMSGYLNDDDANKKAFREDWLKTGDLGLLDEEGYLFIRGRSKEIINRGGEKVSPYEVEERLLKHPAVKEAVIFPVPHQYLLEDMAAAVVLNEGSLASEEELRDFITQELSYFKVPRRVIIVQDIPKGTTGKIRRSELALHFGIEEKDLFRTFDGEISSPPMDEIESLVAKIYSDALDLERVGIHDDFLDLGGDSIQAMQIASRLRNFFGIEIPVTLFFAGFTVARISERIRENKDTTSDDE